MNEWNRMRIVIRSTDGDDVRETTCQRRTCVEKNRGSRRRWESRVAVNVSVRKGGVSSALRELLRAHADLDRICVLVVEAHVERCCAAFASKDTRHWPRRIRACGRGKQSESKKASDGSHCCEGWHTGRQCSTVSVAIFFFNLIFYFIKIYNLFFFRNFLFHVESDSEYIANCSTRSLVSAPSSIAIPIEGSTLSVAWYQSPGT